MKMNTAAGQGDRLLLGKKWPSGLDLIYSEQIGPNVNTSSLVLDKETEAWSLYQVASY